ncbi:hypothetical protein Droror1_Dr00004846 [Drosera rotundifolia]
MTKSVESVTTSPSINKNIKTNSVGLFGVVGPTPAPSSTRFASSTNQSPQDPSTCDFNPTSYPSLSPLFTNSTSQFSDRFTIIDPRSNRKNGTELERGVVRQDRSGGELGWDECCIRLLRFPRAMLLH